ncbi:MAG TPA: hypothetical protein ENI23_06830 [bacterium]|nr:hypothetical protein [bacterium]
MNTYFLGVDPGLYGYIGLLGPDFRLELIPNPTIDKNYDPAMIAKTLKKLKNKSKGNLVACIERVQAFPKIGIVSNTKQFYCAGIFHSAFHCLDIPFMVIRAQEWKKKILKGLPKGKQASVVFINNRFPALRLTELYTKKQQDNVADALCLALFGRYQHLGIEF